MKISITVLAVVLFMGLLNIQEQKSASTEHQTGKSFFCPAPPTFPESIKKSNGDEKVDQSWYQKAIENIEKEEYSISYSEELGAYQSPNRANNIRFIYHKDGFTAKTRDNKIPLFDVNDKTIEEKDKKYEEIEEWSVKLKIKNEKLKIESGEIKASGNKAWIENDRIRIDYTNTKEGMRQDFTIKQKPAGEGKLRLNLSADTKLKMIVGADALMFKDNNGEDKMKYSALKCWDANGKELRAYFEKNQLGIKNYELGIGKNKIRNSKFLIPNSFSIVVNDEDAVYPITIDPLSENPDWTKEGNQAGAQFGYCVATAGDVNGDGYSDVIVGAPYYDNGQTDEGRVYVLHGSSTGLSASTNWTFENDTAGSSLGYSVSTAGDVNNDGYSDVMVGAPEWNNTGKVYVFHGSSSGLSATDNWQKQINQSDAGFGTSVSSAGDINGDGYSDVIIGAPYANDGESDEGRANTYLGSSTGLAITIHKRLEINSIDANFGYSVSLAGDVNGDGYSDVIIGAPKFSSGQIEEGKSFIHLGTSSGIDSVAFWTKESNQAYAHLGSSVSGAGDVNGDGLSDVIIGAPEYDNSFTNAGKVYVFHGNSISMPSAADWTEDVAQEFAYFGNSVSTAGDVNGDGYCDVIIGSYGFSNGNTSEGKVFAYFGSSSGLPSSHDWTDEVHQDYAFFGWCVATAGDVNGDGFSDVIVGAPLYESHSAQNNEGTVQLFNGIAGGLSLTENWTIAGYDVSTAGDVNGDGYSDVIVKYYYPELTVHIFHGSSLGLLPTPNWITESNEFTSFLSVSTAGDVNGDGYSDVIIGDYEYNFEAGAVFLWYGSSSGLGPNGTPSNADWTAECNDEGALFGRSIATAGDVNGDGYSDVIVGAAGYDNGQINHGAAFLWYGSSSGLGPNGTPSNAGWTGKLNTDYSSFGTSVSSAGDVNGDGYSDVIVGAPNYSYGVFIVGAAFVYHGSPTGLISIPYWVEHPFYPHIDTYFGYSVSTAGDVNGDGYSDVIVGAKEYEDGQTREGAAFVWHGSSSGLSGGKAGWTAESNQDGAQFGSSIATAGDVNGDGYSDVIVGAIGYANGLLDYGAAFLWYGSSSGLGPNGTPANADWFFEAQGIFTSFRGSAKTVGDVNGDGYSDVSVIGDSVFVYYGNGGAGKKTTLQQFKPGVFDKIYSGGYSGVNGQAKLSIFGICPFGRADGKIVYEYRDNGAPFSGTTITNSTLSSGAGIITDLNISGIPLNKEVSGLLTNKEYKWRARVEYNLVNNPLQKLGPWKYFSSYIPIPSGGFKAIDNDSTAPIILYSEIPDTGSISNIELRNVEITDEHGVQGASGTRPRIYYKRVPDLNTYIGNTNSTGGWKYAEASGSTSPFSFTIDYSLLNGGISKGDTIMYFIIAQDIHTFGSAHVGINSGIFASKTLTVNLSSSAFPITGSIRNYKIIPPPKLELSMLIQGFYYPALNLMVQDTVTVYLRNSSPPYAIVDSAKGYLSSTGIDSLIFHNSLSGADYYIQLKHRNSVETWSKTPQVFPSGYLTYDFSSSAEQAFGDNMKQVDNSPVRFAIYGGDVNQDGTVDATDVSTIDNDASNFVSGYVVTDLTGDDFVDGTDFAIADNNAANFVSVIRP